MNQLSQSYATGQSELVDVPVPTSAPCDGLLLRTAASVVSVGTEKGMLDVARKSKPGELTSKPEAMYTFIVPFGLRMFSR